MEDILTAPPRNTAPTKPVATKREPGQAALYPTQPKATKAAVAKRRAEAAERAKKAAKK
jgi:hypothetical protein